VSAEPEPIKTGFSGFRTKLLVAMMLVVTAATALALFLAQQSIAETVKRDFEREFQGEVNTLLSMQQVRRAALVERCRALARKPRIHAALEDNALELLYPSARDELLDLMQGEDVEPASQNPYAFHALFYRFLDAAGVVIPPPDAKDVGSLTPEEERQLLRAGVVQAPQIGYLLGGSEGGDHVSEVMAMPIISTETGQPIAVLEIGFRPTSVISRETNAVIKTGLWVGGQLHLNPLPAASQAAIVHQLQNRAVAENAPEGSFRTQIEGTSSPWLLFYKLMNPGSAFPPAYQVCLYPLVDSMARQHRLFWQFTGAGVLLLVGAFAASRFISIKLSVPVEKLAVDSETNRTERQRAEIALEMTHDELQRSARFSANASHQLKTPVTVLRAGLEELLAGEKLQTEVREEIATLVHQTFRLTSIIEDLLLLSRMDAGRLKLELGAVNLSELIASWLDDLEALPDQLHIKIETDFPPALFILGEKRYTSLILQNLLENARKYNRPGGTIRVAAKAEGSEAILTVGNTGTPIPTEAQPHIFERFHRGSVGENVSGHGLGLNLARELARLHHGDLRLNCSDDTWTEFEARFRLASPTGR
jgi:signal transduction histidine kinase